MLQCPRKQCRHLIGPAPSSLVPLLSRRTTCNTAFAATDTAAAASKAAVHIAASTCFLDGSQSRL